MASLKLVRIALPSIALGLMSACGELAPTDPSGGPPTPSDDARSVAVTRLAPGAIDPFTLFDPGLQPEGVALDALGNVFVGLRHRDPVTGAYVRNEILRYDLHGGIAVVAELGAVSPGRPGLLGLATNGRGDLYAAYASFDPATGGVYEIARGGGAIRRLPGSSGIVFPNALAIDASGNLYVTDSFAGAVWRSEDGGALEPWSQHALLAPVPVPGFPALPGANGITARPGGGLYVANTARGLVLRIALGPDGAPGVPEIVASGLVGVDGIAASPEDGILAVHAGANLLGVPALYRIAPGSGEVTPITGLPPAFDDPTSVALGRGARDPGRAYVVNSDIFAPTGIGPGVVAVGIR